MLGVSDNLDYLRKNDLAAHQIIVPTNAGLKKIEKENMVSADYFKTVNAKDLETHLEKVRLELKVSGNKKYDQVNGFVLVGINTRNNKGIKAIGGLRTVSLDEPALKDLAAGFQIAFERDQEGVWKVKSAKGDGASDNLDHLRRNDLAGSQIIVPTNVGLKIIERGNSVSADYFKTVNAKDLETHLEKVRLELKVSGNKEYDQVNGFVLVGINTKNNKGIKAIVGFRTISLDEPALKDLDPVYFKIKIMFTSEKWTAQPLKRGLSEDFARQINESLHKQN